MARKKDERHVGLVIKKGMVVRVKRHKGRRKKGRKKRKGGKKMPKNVLEYFKLRNQGMSKEKAKKQAGL